MSSFQELYNKNVNEFTEKKGRFNYLSWAFAVKELKLAYPQATYQQVYFDNKPYSQDESGCYVVVRLFLTKDDRKENFYQEFTHPILDNQNRTILKPNSFQVNTSFMRGLTKLIGITTGLGLYIYAGEDIPDEEKSFNQELNEFKEQVKKDNQSNNNPYAKQEKIITMQTEADKKETKRKELEELMQTKAKAGVKVFTDWYQTYITKYPSVLQNKEFLDLVAKHDPTPKTPEDFERAKNVAMQDALEKSQKIS